MSLKDDSRGLDAAACPLQSVGNYDLVEKIGEGGMGTVYKARHRDSGRVVAIKMMPSPTVANPILLKRFEQEFRAASRLDHPNVVRALDYGTIGQTPYLVLEFVDGESLGRKIARDGPIPEAEALRLIAQVAQGLHKAHKQGLIHRDVKPDNILIGINGQAKLADLGLVKEVETQHNLTRTGRGLGTPNYMAPEQFRNAKYVDARSDIYALAATLYLMLTGELPFRANGPLEAWMKKVQNDLVPPRNLVPGLSARTDWAVRRALHADPEDRPSSCREFIEDLIGRSTRYESKVIAFRSRPSGTSTDIWFLSYQNEAGETHIIKSTTQTIRRSLSEGLLGDAGNIRASRTRSGPFEPLRGRPEFRDLVLPLTSSNSGAAPSPSLSGIPQIELAPYLQTETRHRRTWDWLRWLVLTIVWLVAGLVAYHYMSSL